MDPTAPKPPLHALKTSTLGTLTRAGFSARELSALGPRAASVLTARALAVFATSALVVLAAVAATTVGVSSAQASDAPDVAPAADAAPEETRPRAGLVVRFVDGSVREFCVDLGASEITGLELLQRSELGVRFESVAGGAQVCRIGGHGCADSEPCWCQCQVVGPDCVYWAYHTLDDGEWSYSRIGAASRTVRHGDVDGWAWGSGTTTSGAQPPQREFDDLCSDQGSTPDQPAETSPPPAVPSGTIVTSTPGDSTPGAEQGAPGPSAEPPSGTVEPTVQAGSVAPTAPGPAARPDEPPATRTPRPTRTPRAAGTDTSGTASSPDVEATSASSGTADSAGTLPGQPGDAEGTSDRTVDAVLRATSDARLATIAALAYAPGALDSELGGGAAASNSDAIRYAGAAAISDVSSSAGAASGSLASADRAGDLGPRPGLGGQGGSGGQGAGNANADTADSHRGDRIGDAGVETERSSGAGYLVFGVVTVALGAAFTWFRVRRSSTATR